MKSTDFIAPNMRKAYLSFKRTEKEASLRLQNFHYSLFTTFALIVFYILLQLSGNTLFTVDVVLIVSLISTAYSYDKLDKEIIV